MLKRFAVIGGVVGATLVAAIAFGIVFGLLVLLSAYSGWVV